MGEFAGQVEAYLQGYKAAVRDARKEIIEIARLNKPFNVSTVDTVVKDLIKKPGRGNQNEQGAGGQGEVV